MIVIIKWLLGRDLTPSEQRRLDMNILNIKAASLTILMAIILLIILMKVF